MKDWVDEGEDEGTERVREEEDDAKTKKRQGKEIYEVEVEDET